MRIAIDARLAFAKEARGMGQYVESLLYEMPKLFSDTEEIYILTDALENEELIQYLSSFKNIKIIYKNLFFLLWEQLWLPFFLFKNSINVSHFPGDTSPIFKLGTYREILTLHDVAFMKSSKHYPSSNSVRRLMGKFYRYITISLSINRIDKILTVSNFAKSDIISEFSSINPKKIKVIYNGVNEEYLTINIIKKKPQILLVSGSDAQKNLLSFLKAYNQASKRKSLKLSVKIIGASDDDFLSYSKNPNICFLGYVRNNELKKYYDESEFFFLPSLYESFGIPAIEAYSRGCKVFCSNTGALPEVMKNKAIFFNPIDVNEISEKIEYCSLTQGDDIDLSADESFFALFSWKIASKNVIKIYRDE